ncbi:MAG TPA: acyl-CoA dehydrogenase [Steroidobacteraceae bacterium]|nr:acyl-CoA dehydrogenase [Steroidobacteraceae bacterium]
MSASVAVTALPFHREDGEFGKLVILCRGFAGGLLVYRAPVADLRFVLDSLLEAGELARLPRFSEYSADLAAAVLTEADRFASDVLAPLNAPGDRQGAAWTSDGATTPAGFREAYQQYVEGGWPLLGIDTAHGGQGAPQVLSTAVEEIWCGANVAFMLCPLLSRGAIEALLIAGSPQLQAAYLPKMITGHWAGTMNLTEPQAGSDLGAIRTRAAPAEDHYLLTGQKIFITYGDHDLAENIVHLVLARIEGAPAGVKGLSLFVVPKFLPDAAGNPGRRNDVRCVSIEHKLGIHASPTCVLAYGDTGGASAFLVGEANRGLECMFIMMNAARLSVGLQGVGLAESARQRATEWARNRVQGRPVGVAGDKPLTIIRHPDVQRMLLTIRSGVEAMRALAMYAALQLDRAHALPDAGACAAALARGELLIPIVKAWGTEYGTELVSLGLQVHGGMGYIEETGIAQTLRDARITTIYEGTTAIQANDLLGRKLMRDSGAALRSLLDEFDAELTGYRSGGGAAAGSAALPPIVAAAREGLSQLRAAAGTLMPQLRAAPAAAYAVSVPFLRLCGIVLGGCLMARAAHIAARQLAAGGPERAFMRAKLQTAAFYCAQILPQALALSRTVRTGGASVADADVELI